MEPNTDTTNRLYCAIIWEKQITQTEKRVTVYAPSLPAARQQLEAEYGKGNVFDLHNPEDADKPR